MKELNFYTRLKSMAIDLMLMTFLTSIFSSLGILCDFFIAVKYPNFQMDLFSVGFYFSIFGFSLILNKDIIGGRSFAKRILHLQIVEIHSNQVSNPLKNLIRNLTIIIWPIELFAVYKNHERRFGDFIAGTKVTHYSSASINRKPQYSIFSLILSIIISFFIVLLPFIIFLVAFS